MESKPIIFGECATELRDKVQPDGANGAKYIGLEHIEQGTLHLNGFGSANDVSSTKSKFSKGDILFGKLRPYFRKVVRAPFDGVCSTDIWVVSSTNGIDQGFLYYWMASQEFVDFSMQGSEGTKMPRAKWDHVSRHQIPYFSKSEQKAIAHILGSLDYKIELNRRMNETLEAIAQALFKSWFVDFDPVIDNALAAGNEIPEELKERADIREALGDARKPLPEEIQTLFPSSFEQTEEMGWIPKGWKMKFLENAPLFILDGDRGKNYPKRTEFCQRGHCLFLNTGNVTKNGFNFTSTDFISEGRDKLLGKGKLQRGDIILTTRGTVGNFAYFDKNIPFDHIRINSGMVILRPSEDVKYSFFLFPFFKSNSFYSQVKGLTTGSAQPQLPIRDIKKIMIPLPNNTEILSCYIKLIEGSFDQTGMRAEQSRILSKLRDTILPQLLSGGIRVPDAAKLVEGLI